MKNRIVWMLIGVFCVVLLSDMNIARAGFECDDGVCDAGETCESCSLDCGCFDDDDCTDDVCDPTDANADLQGCVYTYVCGACCVDSPLPLQTAGDSFCVNTSSIECVKLFGGSFLGDGTFCDDGPCGRTGACCHTPQGGAAASDAVCDEFSPAECERFGGTYFGDGTSCSESLCAAHDQRLSTVKKGSLLIFPNVELGWSAGTVAGGGPILTRDTVITLVNDFSRDVKVKLYYVNGDAPTDPIYADELHTILVERAHNGWNQVDFTVDLSENESTYIVLSTGVGGGQRFTILDPGNPPGRPSLEPDGGRVLGGFVIAFAVDENQNEISWNHLSGHADIIDYGLRSAWEYQAYAFQATNPTVGAPTDGHPGQLNLDGVEYDYAFNTLLFDFYAVGSTAFSNGNVRVLLDSQLTLMPVSTDLRQDSCGPITTKAHFDIWNANEDFRSGTTRCITCWDQTLLSAYSLGNGLDNNFLLADLGTDKGKARIDGQSSFECDNLYVPGNLEDAILQWLLLHDHPQCDPGCDIAAGKCVVAGGGNGIDHCCRYTINDSLYAALLGVAAKQLTFSIGATGRTWAGMNLVGAGQEFAQILFDVPAGPEPGRSTRKNENQRINAMENTQRK